MRPATAASRGSGSSCSNLRRHHQQRPVQALEGDPRRCVEMSGQVDNQQVVGPAAGVKDSAHRGRRHIRFTGAVPRQHGEVVHVQERLRQRIGTDPARRAGEVGPTQAAGALRTDREIDAATERIGVDQQGAAAQPAAGDRECDGERRSSGTAAATDDPEHDRRRSVAFDRIRDPLHQPRLGARQKDHMLGTELDSSLVDLRPDPGVAQIRPDEHDAGAAAEPGSRNSSGEVFADEHEGRAGPARPGGRRIGGDLRLGPGRGSQPDQVVEHRRGSGDDERPALAGRGFSGWRWDEHRDLRGAGGPDTVVRRTPARDLPEVELWMNRLIQPAVDNFCAGIRTTPAGG